MRGAVLRLEWRVRDEGVGGVRLENLRWGFQGGFGVAVLAKRTHGRLFRELFGAARESFAALLRGLALVPLHLQFLPCGTRQWQHRRATRSGRCRLRRRTRAARPASL